MICRTLTQSLVCLCHVHKGKFCQSKTVNVELEHTARQAAPSMEGASWQLS